MAGTFFEGFDESRVDVGDGVELRVRTGSSGPPVVLLHGHPRTHDLEELFGDPRAIWADWTTDLGGGRPIGSGHHMAEEAPDELAAALAPFSGCDHLRPPG